MSVANLRVSPENNELYRPVDPADPEIVALAQSIKKFGVQQQLIVTPDGYILSGHRRYAAAKLAGVRHVVLDTLSGFDGGGDV